MRVLFNTYTFIDLISVVYFRQLFDVTVKIYI